MLKTESYSESNIWVSYPSPIQAFLKTLALSEQLWLLAPTLLVFPVSWLYVFVEVHFMLNKLYVLLCTLLPDNISKFMVMSRRI